MGGIVAAFIADSNLAYPKLVDVKMHGELPSFISTRRINAMEDWIANGTLLKADANAQYAAVIEIDLAEVTEPILACPNDPDEVKVLSEVAGAKIDEVFIGSCITNIGHFRAAGIAGYPGLLPGAITSANIQYARSKARNPLLASNLREFPVPPNIDDGEGVRMMFGEMAAAQLYPPQYRQNTDAAIETLSLTLFNEDRPAVWVEVSDWIERNGPIANSDVCRIATVDTLKASKMLRGWVDRGLLEPLPGRARSNAAYRRPSQADEQLGLLQAEDDSAT